MQRRQEQLNTCRCGNLDRIHIIELRKMSVHNIRMISSIIFILPLLMMVLLLLRLPPTTFTPMQPRR